MPKRHNHYRSTGGRGGHGDRGGRRRQGNWRNRSNERIDRNFMRGRGHQRSNFLKATSPLGNGDLGNADMEEVFFGNHVNPGAVEDYYFGHRGDKSMMMGGFRPGLREERPSDNRLAFRKRPMKFVKAKDVYDPSHDIIEALRMQNSHLIEPSSKVEGKNEQKNRDEEQQVEQDVNKKEVKPEVVTEKNEELYTVDNENEKNKTVLKNIPIEEEVNEKSNKVTLTISPNVSKESINNHHVESSPLSGTMGRLQLSEDPLNSQDGKIPFGTAAEDSLVDLSDIFITNVRVGFVDDSYYVKSLRMFDDHEPRWVDKQNLTDFLLEELNFPEHRLEAYLEFIKESLIKKEESGSEPTFSDFPSNSDQSGDEDERYFNGEENVSVTSDMREGLDDLVAYTEKYNVGRNMEYETSTMKFVGKGKKKKLLIDESKGLDSATIYTLEDKLKNRLESKAKKRRTKQDFIDENNQFSEDLFKKYPVGLHIQNIKDECELFLLKEKDRLTFPPLDPHGNNVILKMSHHFNLKGYREGSGSFTHVIAQKTRGTTRYSPNYDRIHQLLRQRPVFYRIDVNRPGNGSTERIRKSGARFHTKEGQVVGQDAPVIGSDNIGRKMLEKLGWSNGEGLGAHGNKGIAEPLMATVKKNKLGLKQSQE